MFKSSDGTRFPGHWGELAVPENRREANSRRITLRFRCLGTHGAPALFYFTGGPGMSNLKQTYPARLLNAYSVVEVGYRGIDSSPNLECAALKRAFSPKGDLLPSNVRAAVATAFEGCLQEWKRAGVDYRGYQIRDVIEDAEAVRRALALDRVNLFAGSYGTRVALYYMTLYPERIERAVLVGANPPGHFFWSAEDVHKGFESYQTHFELSYPKYRGRLSLEKLCSEVLEMLPRRAAGVRLDPGRIRVMSFVMLFNRTMSAYVFDAYLRAYESHNFHGLAVLSFLYDLTIPRAFHWGDFFLKGLSADYDATRDYLRESAPSPARFGSPLGEIMFAPPYSTAALAYRDSPLELRIETPTLILNGDLDFSTPARTAREELTDRFPRIQQWSEPRLGHIGDFWQQNDTLSRAVIRFLENQELPDHAFSSQPVTFSKRIGLAHVPLLLILAALGVAAAAARLWAIVWKRISPPRK